MTASRASPSKRMNGLSGEALRSPVMADPAESWVARTSLSSTLVGTPLIEDTSSGMVWLIAEPRADPAIAAPKAEPS